MSIDRPLGAGSTSMSGSATTPPKSGTPTTPGAPTTQGRPVTSTAASTPGSASGDTGVKQAAEQAVTQTRELASDAKQHLSSMVQQTRGELREQADQRGRQLSEGLDSLARQIRGLRNGQPDQAGSLQHYLVDAEQRLSSWAQRLERGGPDLVLADVRSMARRRPGTFLVGALGAGFVAGRLLRIGIAAAQEQSSESSGATGAYGTTGTGTTGMIGAGGTQVQQGLSASGMPASASSAGVIR